MRRHWLFPNIKFKVDWAESVQFALRLIAARTLRATKTNVKFSVNHALYRNDSSIALFSPEFVKRWAKSANKWRDALNAELRQHNWFVDACTLTAHTCGPRFSLSIVATVFDRVSPIAIK